MSEGSISGRDLLDELREFRRETNERFASLQSSLQSAVTSVAVEQTHRQALESRMSEQSRTLAEHGRQIGRLRRWRAGIAAVLAVVVLAATLAVPSVAPQIMSGG